MRKSRHYRFLSPPTTASRAVEKLNRSISTGNWAPEGPRSKDFTAALAQRLDIPPEWIVLTDSCTTALAAAARLQDWGGLIHGDCAASLRVCPLTWPSTYSWAHPDRIKWVDCDDDGWPVSEVDVAVDLWGRRWAGDYGLQPPKIIDAAHRFGDREHAILLQERDAEAVCYSFAPQKEVACFMGGALVSPRAGEALDWLRSGSRDRIYAGAGGVKGLMPDPVAAFLNQQLKHHDGFKERRRIVLEEYATHLGKSLLVRPGEASGHLCVVDCGSPAIKRLWQTALEKAPAIQYGHHYLLNEEQREACPNAAALSDRILTLPLHARMTRWDVRRVVARLLHA